MKIVSVTAAHDHLGTDKCPAQAKERLEWANSAHRRGVGTWRIGRLLPGAFSSCRYVRRLGRTAEARSSYEKALALTQQEPERQFLQERIRQLK